jgi:uncharacterized membrane protein
MANFFLKVGPEVRIPFWKSELVFTLALPFSWKMFYFSSVAFVIASTIYLIRCPKIISEYEGYLAFKHEGNGQDRIKEEFLKAIGFWKNLKVEDTSSKEAINAFIRRYCSIDNASNIRDYSGEVSGTLFMEMAVVPQEHLHDAFWYVRDLSDRRHSASRVACTAFYFIAIILILAVFYQNFNYVVKLA